MAYKFKVGNKYFYSHFKLTLTFEIRKWAKLSDIFRDYIRFTSSKTLCRFHIDKRIAEGKLLSIIYETN